LYDAEPVSRSSASACTIGVVNNDGHPATLVAAHPENTNAVKSGVYSRTGRVLSPRAAEIADTIMSCALIREPDEFAAAEVGRLVALIEAMDEEIAKNGLTRRGDVRSIVKLRLQASRRLEEWLNQLGFTPRARAELVSTIARGGLAAEIARRRAPGQADGDVNAR
jgi:hypothetical protein